MKERKLIQLPKGPDIYNYYLVIAHKQSHLSKRGRNGRPLPSTYPKDRASNPPPSRTETDRSDSPNVTDRVKSVNDTVNEA